MLNSTETIGRTQRIPTSTRTFNLLVTKSTIHKTVAKTTDIVSYLANVNGEQIINVVSSPKNYLDLPTPMISQEFLTLDPRENTTDVARNTKAELRTTFNFSLFIHRNGEQITTEDKIKSTIVSHFPIVPYEFLPLDPDENTPRVARSSTPTRPSS